MRYSLSQIKSASTDRAFDARTTGPQKETLLDEAVLMPSVTNIRHLFQLEPSAPTLGQHE